MAYSSGYIRTPEADEKVRREADYYRQLDLDWQSRSVRAADNRRRRELGLPPKTTPVIPSKCDVMIRTFLVGVVVLNLAACNGPYGPAVTQDAHVDEIQRYYAAVDQASSATPAVEATAVPCKGPLSHGPS